MNRAGEKVISIANSNDKRQVTAVFMATMTCQYLPPQVIYKGKIDVTQGYMLQKDGIAIITGPTR